MDTAGRERELPDRTHDLDPTETQEWLDALDDLLYREGRERVRFILDRLVHRAYRRGLTVEPPPLTTPYRNSIPASEQPPYPGRLAVERRIEAFIRWNAMAMVVRANRGGGNLGGHISTYASAATLYEVAYHHVFRAGDEQRPDDLIFYQGHGAPGFYARAFLEGRLTEAQLGNFRRELAPEGGLSSYPHPWLMPDFWQAPSVSMGLGGLMAIYQARFSRYLRNRGLVTGEEPRVWAFLGDGEMDEPETVGALSVAAREQLDNLTFVVNCNLQRLDGPVRGNGKIIQELEGIFRGAGWQVIKVVWSSDWDPLFAADREGHLAARLEALVDGEAQRLSVLDGAELRRELFDTPELQALVAHLSDDQLENLRRGGHDPLKVYAAYRRALETKGRPTVILAKTIKGYGAGEALAGRNTTHSQKKLDDGQILAFRNAWGIPLDDDQARELPFLRFDEESEEFAYLAARRRALGGWLPRRRDRSTPVDPPEAAIFEEFEAGSGDRSLSTTMAFVRLLGRLLRDPAVGPRVVPIVPDEARTFGMEPLFRQYGIYSPLGQRYTPVDRDQLLYYRESTTGQVLEEGITEAGAMSSFIAAGTSYATQGVAMLPFFVCYSMFSLQRIMDLAWAASDMRCRGFLVGATAGRTTLNGEGLQHQDGHSLLLASALPTLRAYDPAYAYEIALIVREGIRRMLCEPEDIWYYMTLENENYPMPPMPPGVEEGVLAGMYRLEDLGADEPAVQLLGSGPILRLVREAGRILAEDFGLSVRVWSVTSYGELRRDALEVARRRRLEPEAQWGEPYVVRCLGRDPGVVVAASDYVRLVPEQIAPWVPGMVTLGTDGFGRSDTREALRRFFEVDAPSIAFAALSALARRGEIPIERVVEARRRLGLDVAAPNPIAS